MHDINWLRENPDAFDAKLKARGLEPQAQKLLGLDAERRRNLSSIQQAQASRNELSVKIGAAKKSGGDAQSLMDAVAKAKDEIATWEVQNLSIDAALKSALETLPNLPADDVPLGKDEDDNAEIRVWGQKPALDKPLEHGPLGEKLGMMSAETAAKMSGARFTVLSGGLARLERALGQFMLDLHTREFGYTEVSPPLLVRDNALYGTGQLPKFGDDLFKTTTDHWLIPTAEVSLTNMVADSIVETEALPLRYTALTPCFRSEAGAAGKDTTGMIRQHQFWKVELVSVTTAEQSKGEHERMTAAAEEVLKRLNLPFRTMLLCTGDMGFSAEKTYDIEVWLPGQQRYREISSCSNCGTFQARRMNARHRPRGQKGTQFVHTLNGSGLAVGRALIAVMENYQQPDGSIVVPEALAPYMGGLKVIRAS
jgi:seryl-tRNA synthetase